MKKLQLVLLHIAIMVMCILGSVNPLSAQWNYGTAFSTAAPPASYQQVVNQQVATFLMDSLNPPYPTCSWFMNFLLPSGSWGTPTPLNYNMVGEHVSFIYPYTAGFAWHPPASLKVSAYKVLRIGYDDFNVKDTAGPLTYSVTWPEAQNMMIGSRDSAHILPFVKKFDDFSLTLRWRDTVQPDLGYMEAPIVRGAPYFTMFYEHFRPLICFPSPDLVQVNAHVMNGVNDSVTIKAKQFKLILNGDIGTLHRQIWMVYASDSITLRFRTSKAYCVDTAFHGFLRVAYITTRQRDPHAADSNLRIALLEKYAPFVPTGGTFHATVGTDTNLAQLQFQFATNKPGNDSLLMMALPHHVPMLSNDTASLLKYKCMKGQMTQVFGKTWTLSDTLPDVSWEETYGLENVDSAYLDTLLTFLKMDYDSICGRHAYSIWNGTNSLNSDMYGFGKTSAKWARLALIADELAEWYPECDTIAQGIRDSLKMFVNRILDGRSGLVIFDSTKKDSLYYDTHHGGMISSLSYDHGYYEDFGNALYNDHHFHYGYIAYTAAVIARKDTAWAQAYRDKVMVLIRDIANPSAADPYFVKSRYLDWYDGNSWAKGLEGSGAGRNQESSSEAVNAWYATYLYGLATGDENIKYTGKVMLSSEIRAAKTYYHIPQGSNIYPTSYTNAWKIVGNLWSAGINNLTYFGRVGRYVYGIHVIPVTPITKYLWDDDYAAEVYQHPSLTTDSVFLPHPTTTAVKNWTSICFPIQGLADINAAYDYFHTYSGFNGNFDGGASKTNTYYWLICHKHDPTLGGIGIDDLANKYGNNAIIRNYPNPASDVTTIEFNLSENGPCTVALYDLNGGFVREFFRGACNQGTYQLVCDLKGIPSGTYIYRLTGSVIQASGKLMIIK